MAGPYLSWSCSTADCQLRLSVLYGTMQVHYVLHSRCIGRRVGETDHSDSIDDFRQGILNLGKGKLSTWIKETVSSHLILRNQWPPNLTTQASDLLPDGEDATTGEAEYPTDTAAQPAIGNMFIVDGELVIDTDIHGFDLDIDSTNNMDE